ncbi:MAG: peptidyl-prolyl cis-trans isomerase [Actinomycetia bacterium]|nr:peptidyl-prolyl cis-trans isomerase [Actinomycetes bacterium]
MIAVITLLIILHGCGEQPTDNITNDTAGFAAEYDDCVVLAVGDKAYSGAVLAPALDQLSGDSLMIHLKIESLINRSLILQDAHERGFASTPSMELTFGEWEREKLQNLWLIQILDQRVQLPTDTVEQYYSQMGTMLIYSEIIASDSAQCDSLRQLVQSGVNMGDLAEENSIIPYGVSSRGVHRPVDMMEVFSEDFALIQDLDPGELSSLDLSDYGWRFLRIDSIYQDTIPPLADLRNVIEAKILGRLKLVYKEELFDSLRTANNLQIIDGIPELISSHFSPNSLNYEPFTSEQENMLAYTFNEGEITLYSLAENIRKLPPMSLSSPDDPEWIKEHALTLGLNDIMAMEATKLSMDTLPDVVSYMEQRFGNHVLDFYYAEVIEPRLIPSEEKLLEVYEAERDSFIIPEGRVFNTISAVGEEQLDLLAQVLESGANPFSLSEEFTTVQGVLASGESIITRPLIASEIPPPWGEMLFSAGMHETITCSVEVERVLVFELTEISPEHIATFSESRDKVMTIFLALEEEEVISGLVDSLSSVYHIEVDWGFVDRFIYADSSTTDQL